MKVRIGYEKNISHADIDKVVYEDKKNVLEETWDVLRSKYISDAERQHQEQIKDFEMLKMINCARVEMETGLQSELLVSDMVLEERVAKEECKVPKSLRAKCVEDIVRILDKNLEVLEEGYAIENRAWESVKDHCDFHRFVFTEDGMQLFYTRTDFVLVSNTGEVKPGLWDDLGLCCVIRYKGLVLEAFLERPLRTGNVLERMKRFFVEKGMVQKQRTGDVEIGVARGKGKGGNGLCKYVLLCLERGYELEEIFGDVLYGLALYMGRALGFREFLNGFKGENVLYCIKAERVLEIRFTWDGFFEFALCGVPKAFEALSTL